MQPYRNIQQQKGLFTFYREQAQIQDKYQHIKRKRLSNGLYQNNHIDIEPNELNDNKKFTNLQPQKSLRFNLMRNVNYSNKLNDEFENLVQNQQVKDKSQLDNNTKRKIKQNQYSQITIQKVVLEKQAQKTGIINNMVHKIHPTVSFKKYNSQIDQLKYKKLKKMYVQQNSQKNQQFDITKRQVAKHNQQKIQQNIMTKNQYKQLFKRLAIQPKQFQNSVIQVSSDTSMVRQHKKQKTGLKCYKRQKTNNVTTDLSSLKIKIGKDNSLQSNDSQQQKFTFGEQLRHIRTEKNSIKFNAQQNQRLSKVKDRHLPVISKQRKPDTDRGYCMQYQLQRSSQLKNKYSIKKMEQQQHHLLQISSHMKKGSLNRQQIHKAQNVDFSSDVKVFPIKKQDHSSIFVNRKNHKNLLKNIRIPTFQQANCNQKQIQKQILIKKKQLLNNLLQNFNFL